MLEGTLKFEIQILTRTVTTASQFNFDLLPKRNSENVIMQFFEHADELTVRIDNIDAI
jgi:hypothetical protein